MSIVLHPFQRSKAARSIYQEAIPKILRTVHMDSILWGTSGLHKEEPRKKELPKNWIRRNPSEPSEKVSIRHSDGADRRRAVLKCCSKQH